MPAVLDFDPVIRPSGTIAAICTFRDQALKSHVACGLEQVGADLALLERRREDAVGVAREQAREVGLAHGERQPAQVVAVEREAVEGVELHLNVVSALMQGVGLWNGLQENPLHFAWRSFPTSKGEGHVNRFADRHRSGLYLCRLVYCKRPIRRAAIAQQQEQD
jgi:hypothetical protein